MMGDFERFTISISLDMKTDLDQVKRDVAAKTRKMRCS